MRLATLAFCLTVVSCERVSLTPFALEPCHLDGLAEEVRCGVHEVFEDRASLSGKTTSDSGCGVARPAAPG